MDFWEVVAKRHSIRRYDPVRDVPQHMIDRILDAAVQAPSAGNCQTWHFIVVRNEDLKSKLASAAHGQMWVADAPVVIGVCAVPARTIPRYGVRGRDLYCIQDTAAATEHILLAVTALGLGACWVGAFDERAASSVLDLPDDLRLVAMVPIGYPAQPSSRATSRRTVPEVSESRA